MGSSTSVIHSHCTMNSFTLGLVVTIVIAQVTGQCQSPGNAMCYDATAGAVTGSCCSGSQCQPYIPSGTTPTGAVDWYCQYLNKLALGESCANKVGTCDSGLNCVSGVCSDQATTTVATTTASCRSPGNALCYDATAGALVSSCCSGSQCQPYIPSGTTPTGAVDWYCQYLNKLALGESCANKVGTCDTNLNCIDGVCSDQATTTTTTTASPDTTTATTTASTDTTTTTTTASSDTTTADATTTTSSD